MEPERVQISRGAQTVADAHGLHRAMHDALVQRLQVGRHLRHARCLFEHGRIELVDRERAVREAGGDGLRSAHRVARQHRLHRSAHAQQPRLPRHVGAGHQAHRRVADLSVLRHVDQVARARQLGAAGEAEAVHLGDDRRGHVPHLEPAGDDVPCPCSVSSAHRPRQRLGRVLGEVVARAEAAAGAAHDHDVHVRVGIAGSQRGEQLASQRVRQRVALVGAVQREASHVGDRVIDEDECHAPSLADRWTRQAPLAEHGPDRRAGAALAGNCADETSAGRPQVAATPLVIGSTVGPRTESDRFQHVASGFSS